MPRMVSASCPGAAECLWSWFGMLGPGFGVLYSIFHKGPYPYSIPGPSLAVAALYVPRLDCGNNGEDTWQPHPGFCLHQPQVMCEVQYQLCWGSLHTSVTNLRQVDHSRFPSLAAAPSPGSGGYTHTNCWTGRVAL